MLLKPSWSFFNKKGNKRRIQKKGQHLLLSLPMRRRETGNTFRIQKKGQQQVSNLRFAAKGQEQYAQLGCA